MHKDITTCNIEVGWLVGFGFNSHLRQYLSLYRAVSQGKGGREERIDESKNVQTTTTRTYCKCSRPLPYCNPNCRTPQHWKFPSTIAPPDHPLCNIEKPGQKNRLGMVSNRLLGAGGLKLIILYWIQTLGLCICSGSKHLVRMKVS